MSLYPHRRALDGMRRKNFTAVYFGIFSFQKQSDATSAPFAYEIAVRYQTVHSLVDHTAGMRLFQRNTRIMAAVRLNVIIRKPTKPTVIIQTYGTLVRAVSAVSYLDIRIRNLYRICKIVMDTVHFARQKRFFGLNMYFDPRIVHGKIIGLRIERRIYTAVIGERRSIDLFLRIYLYVASIDKQGMPEVIKPVQGVRRWFSDITDLQIRSADPDISCRLI